MAKKTRPASRKTVAKKGGGKQGAKRGGKSAASRAPKQRGAPPQPSEPATKVKTDLTPNKIFPRNLTARAGFSVAGNPAVTRPEGAVANCFPGLELDVRNLDRRFFPGLVFNFVEPADKKKPHTYYGAKLAYVDVLVDPDLQLDLKATRHRIYDVLKVPEKVAQTLHDQLTGADGAKLAEGNWCIDWIGVNKKKIATTGLTGLTVWRLIRGLEPGLVSIGLGRKHDKRAEHEKNAEREKSAKRDKKADTVVLHGWRRLYTDPTTGVISSAFQPGELMQGLCSPWQHDFRDCYCHYWASNRPDLVFGDVYPGESLLPDGEAEDPSLNIPLDWMRADRSRPLAVKAFGIIEENRPYQFDHYQINHEWQKLNIVLGGREIDSVRLSEPLDAANPFKDPAELALWLRTCLAPLELTLMFEYLYARFSLRDPKKIANPALGDAVTLTQGYLLLTCISEMQHLRWGNEILWELSKANLISAYEPVIKSSAVVPSACVGPLPQSGRTIGLIADHLKAERVGQHRSRPLARPTDADVAAARSGSTGGKWRERTLRLLSLEAQQDYINIEHPSAFIDSAYAQVVATLAQTDIYPYPPHLVELARRIVGDGVQHEARFSAIMAALKPYKVEDYLRTDMKPGSGAKVAPALKCRDEIMTDLREAYAYAASNYPDKCAGRIADARLKMTKLLAEGEALAEQNIGIPFFDGI